MLDELEKIDDRTGYGRNNKMTKLIKCWKGLEDRHDRLRPVETWHIKEGDYR